MSEPCVQIGKNLWNNFVSPASMRGSNYDDSLELLCPDANAPLPLTGQKPLSRNGAAGESESDGANVLKRIQTENTFYNFASHID